METKLKQLTAELELLKEGYNVIYKTNIDKLDSIIRKYIDPFNGIVVRRYYDSGWENKIRVFIELGFYNEKEERTDFGSTFDVIYESKNDCISVNYGTIGTFNKEDVFQVRRIAMLNNIFEHVTEIEEELRNFSNKISPDLIAHDNERYDLEHRIREVEHNIQTAAYTAIENSLTIGCELAYSPSCSILYDYRLFRDYPITITSSTPKFITAKDTEGNVFKIRKEKLVQHIYNKYIDLKGF